MNSGQIKRVREALAAAEAKHPFWPVDNISAAALILIEEAGEVAKAVNDYRESGGALEDIEAELYQTAAMCFRMLNNLGGGGQIKDPDGQIIEEQIVGRFNRKPNNKRGGAADKVIFKATEGPKFSTPLSIDAILRQGTTEEEIRTGIKTFCKSAINAVQNLIQGLEAAGYKQSVRDEARETAIKVLLLSAPQTNTLEKVALIDSIQWGIEGIVSAVNDLLLYSPDYRAKKLKVKKEFSEKALWIICRIAKVPHFKPEPLRDIRPIGLILKQAEANLEKW